MIEEKFEKSMHRKVLQDIAEKTKELHNIYKNRKLFILESLESIIKKSFKYVDKKIELLTNIKRNLPIDCVVEDKSNYLTNFKYIYSELNTYIKDSNLSRSSCLRS